MLFRRAFPPTERLDLWQSRSPIRKAFLVFWTPEKAVANPRLKIVFLPPIYSSTVFATLTVPSVANVLSALKPSQETPAFMREEAQGESDVRRVSGGVSFSFWS